jgi:hypothetical protein
LNGFPLVPRSEFDQGGSPSRAVLLVRADMRTFLPPHSADSPPDNRLGERRVVPGTRSSTLGLVQPPPAPPSPRMIRGTGMSSAAGALGTAPRNEAGTALSHCVNSTRETQQGRHITRGLPDQAIGPQPSSGERGVDMDVKRQQRMGSPQTSGETEEVGVCGDMRRKGSRDREGCGGCGLGISSTLQFMLI